MKKTAKTIKKSIKKKGEFRDHQEKLLQDLQDPELATAYLNVALMDEDPRMFLVALQNVYEALGIPMNEPQQTTKTKSLFSKKLNPEVLRLLSLMKASHVSLSLNIPKK